MLMTTLCRDRIVGFFANSVHCSSLSLFHIPLVKTSRTLYIIHCQGCFSYQASCKAQCHTPGAELHHLAPLWHQVVTVWLSDSSLDGNTILRPRAEEPVSPHCHGKRHGLGHQLSWHILEDEAGRSWHQGWDARLYQAAVCLIYISKQRLMQFLSQPLPSINHAFISTIFHFKPKLL